MKKLIGLVIFALVAVMAYTTIKKVSDDKKEKALQDDYAKINTIITSIDELIHSPAVNAFGDARTIYQFRFNDIKGVEQEFYKKLIERVGSDFNGKLSNGDVIYMQVNAHTQHFWVYAGGTDNENMLYPDWKYTKVPKR